MRELTFEELNNVNGAGPTDCFPCPIDPVFWDDVLIVCPPPPQPVDLAF